MIDPATEELVRFQEAGRRIPGNPSVCALHRWRLNGVRGEKLETLLVGGTRFTSTEAIARFIQAQNHNESRGSTHCETKRNAGRDREPTPQSR